MEEQQNQLVAVSNENELSEKQKKSLNRRFGFLLGVVIVLAILLVVEIILLFVR